jgi:hypothetical protein
MGYVVGGVGGRVTDNVEDDEVVIRGFVPNDHVPVLPVPFCRSQMTRKEEEEEEEGGIVVSGPHGPTCIIGVDGRRGGGRDIVIVIEPQRRRCGGVRRAWGQQ